MKPTFLQSLTLRAVVPSALMLLVSVPAFGSAATPAQDHLVSPQAMQKQMADSASARQKNIETIQNFLSTPVADRAMRDAHYNPEQVKNAVSSLSDQEVASLAARSSDHRKRQYRHHESHDWDRGQFGRRRGRNDSGGNDAQHERVVEGVHGHEPRW